MMAGQPAGEPVGEPAGRVAGGDTGDTTGDTTGERTGTRRGRHVPWGRLPYARVHAWQQRLVVARADGRVPDLLLTGEHEPVVTLGRRTPDDARYDAAVPRVVVERGGEATWHGPGQLVAYPLVHLIEARRDLHAFQRDLEEIGLRTLADFGVVGTRVAGWSGVWVEGKKVMSLGIAVRRWVTWHGLALNVDADLAAFRAFRPCGLDGNVMTNLAACAARSPSVAEVEEKLVRHAAEVLGVASFARGALPPDLEP